MTNTETRSVAYLHHHINTTFKKECEERVVMNIDWHDGHGISNSHPQCSYGVIQASLNMSEPLDEVADGEDLAQLGSKLTLLLPPFNPDSDEYDYVELIGDEPLDEDFDE
jgi:hypothetical protein